jgi:hypothetical protein
LVGRDRPDEPGEFACAGDDDLLLRLAAAGDSLPALVEALLAAPRALDQRRLVRASATGELVADLRVSPCVPGRLEQEPPDMIVADLGDRPLPALPPEERSAGTSPTKAINSSADLNRSEVADLGSDRERSQGLALPGQTPATNDICVGADHSLPTTRHRDPKATAPSCLKLI